MTPTVSPLSLTLEAVQALVDQNNRVCDAQNGRALDVYVNACHDWVANGIQFRAKGMPLPDKPTQPSRLHVSNVTNGTATSVTSTWTLGPDVLGNPCPDLPPATLPAGIVQLGRLLVSSPSGTYYAVGLQDTTPAGQIVTQDGHSYMKVQSAGAAGTNADGSVPGWYLLIS